MFGITFGTLVVVYGAIAIFHILGKIGKTIGKYENKVSGNLVYVPYGPNGEDYNEPISLLSPHNFASEITRKDGLFYVTIENSVTGDKKTLSNKDKWLLCLDAEEIATKFATREREEFHTV